LTLSLARSTASSLAKEIAFALAIAEDFPALLTPRMNFPLNVLQVALAEAVPTANPSSLSEGELMARFPTLLLVGRILYVLGVLCCGYVIARFFTRTRAGSGDQGPLLKVESKPWDVRDVGRAALIIVLAALILAGVHRLIGLDESYDVTFAVAGQLVLTAGVLTGLAGFFRRRNINWRRAFGLWPGHLRAARQGAIFCLASLPVLDMVSRLSERLYRAFDVRPLPQPVAELVVRTDSTFILSLLVVTVVVVAPVFEEILFRGFSYPALKQRLGTWRATVIISAAFGLIHFHAPSLLPLFILSIGLGLVYELTGSLLAPITMHALFNLTNVAFLLYVRAHS
jgi:membrane protease YdiL (CAAX protease family)